MTTVTKTNQNQEVSKGNRKLKLLIKSVTVFYASITPSNRKQVELETDACDEFGLLTDRESFHSQNYRYDAEISFYPPPMTMISFSLLQIFAFIASRSDYLDELRFNYDPKKRHEIWRFLTYMFVHKDFTHLIFNVSYQMVFGIGLEIVHCWWRIAIIYVSGVLAGSVGASIFDEHYGLRGASAGVYAMIAAHLSTLILNWKDMKYATQIAFIIGVFCSTQIHLSYYSMKMEEMTTSFCAHFFGALAGLLVGIGSLKNLDSQPYQRYLWWLAILTYVTFLLCSAFFHFTTPGKFHLL